MLQNSSKSHNQNTFSEVTSNPKDEMICKDGFCSLPNQKELKKKDTNNMNLFDPI